MIDVMMFDVRTTLTIDDDILAAAKSLAEHQSKSVGEVVSVLARRGLRPAHFSVGTRNGVPLFRVRSGGTPVTPELIKQLQEDPLP